jgi:leader peptidase (prepilin peptidase)/N-methyltransferase
VNVILSCFAFLFGAAIGSFLNVVMYRIPKDISIVKPNSFCPACKKPILWYENIPVLSYIILRGRCSGCHKPISIHYPIVEVLTGCLFVYLFVRYNVALEFLFLALFFCALIVISGIDISYQIIPDSISLPGIIIGIAFSLIQGNFLPGLIGMLFGGGLILLMRVIGGWVYKKEVMGLGDVYLAAMIGAFVGFPLIVAVIFVGALVGAVIGIIYIASTHQSRESPIPFGPFLSIGGIAVTIFDTVFIQLLKVLGISI